MYYKCIKCGMFHDSSEDCSKKEPDFMSMHKPIIPEYKSVNYDLPMIPTVRHR